MKKELKFVGVKGTNIPRQYTEDECAYINKIDKEYKDCECEYVTPYGLVISADCKKHD